MKHLFPLLSVFVLTLIGCGGGSETTNPDERPAPLTKGIFSPIQLQPETTLVHLEDYFPDGDWPDMTGVHSLGLEFRQKEKQLVLFDDGKKIPAVGLLELAFGQHKYHIPLKRSRQQMHRFTFDPEGKTYEKVQVAGSINDWNPANGDMEFKDGKWVLEMPLDPGLYPYQIVVDGEWMLDPANPVSIPNGMGGFNSQLQIGGTGPNMKWKMKKSGRGVEIIVEEDSVNVLAVWNNASVEVTPGEANSYRVTLPEDAAAYDRSYLQIYIGNNATGEVVDCLVPFAHAEPVTQADQLAAVDQHQNILYFLLVDRFHNGDPRIDAPVDDERIDPKANYHGGDLAGVQQKLEEGFFDELGINTIWISPLNQNPEGAFQEYPEPRRWFSGYHGYWPISSSRVDHRFGSNATLKNLVQKAHDRDKKVILDFVANHVHEQHPLMQAHPDWATELYLEDSSLNIRNWDSQRLTTWFDTFLPSLDFSRPEVIETQADSALFWLEQFQLDGFRHDATKHIPTAFWRRLTQKLKQNVDRPLFQIGETFGSRRLIGDYVGSGMLDGQFDFNLYFDLRTALTSETPDAQQIAQSLQASLDFYGHHHLMGNITGNHDMPRFIAYAGGALSFSDDPKEAGWNRNIGVKDPVGYTKLKQLHAFLMVAPGVPVIYYGDEIGMSGADDPDNRRDMRFDGYSEDEASVRATVQELAKFRSSHLATLYGSTETYAPDKETFVMVRRYLGEVVVLILNLGDSDRPVELPAELADLGSLSPVIGPGGNDGISTPAHGFAVLLGSE